jgi:helix-turn-helix protein
MRIRQPGIGSRDVPSQGAPLRAQPYAPGPPPPGPAGRDPQIGQIFSNMRATLRAPREAIARRLATTPGVIEDLENGSVASLPHWRETVRIVRTYCELLRLNPDPLLWRIDQLLRGRPDAPVADESLAPPASPPPLALRKPRSREPMPRQRGNGVGRLLLVATPPVVVAAMVSLAILVPGPIYKTIPLLPASVAEPARAGLDLFVLYSAPRRDGFKWIDVGDPQLRKVDKLPAKPR